MIKTRTGIAFALLAVFALPIDARVKDHRDIEFPRLPERVIPQPTVHTLPNGLQIFLLEDHELPLIRVTGRIRTGSNHEPSDKTGLADFVGQVMRATGGTASPELVNEIVMAKLAG